MIFDDAFDELGTVELASRLFDVLSHDWHRSLNDQEPRCAEDQWRTRDRYEVMYMHEMTDSHLGHCIRFAKTKRQHASRLAALMAEQRRRDEGRPVDKENGFYL